MANLALTLREGSDPASPLGISRQSREYQPCPEGNRRDTAKLKMPGIIGLITKTRPEQAVAELSTMVATLRHEPFYVTGTWIDEAAGVYVGWSALENSFSRGMPVCNERGDVVLVFAGEEYSEPATARRLKERGHT